LAAALVKSGADRAEVMPTDGNPVVYAEKIIDPAAKTVLVYGHYENGAPTDFVRWIFKIESP
jgi:hypothetical protein